MTLENSAERGRVPAVMPVGKLAELLTTYEAPDNVARQIARRAGTVVGPNGIKPEMVERVIIESLEDGLPDWNKVYGKLSTAASRLYKGKSPF